MIYYTENMQGTRQRILFVIIGLLLGFSTNLYSMEQSADDNHADQNLIALYSGDVTENLGETNSRIKESLSEKSFSGYRLGVVQGYVLIVPVVLNQYAEVGELEIAVNYDRNVLKAAGATLAGGILANRGYEMLLDTSASDELKIAIPAAGNIVSDCGKVILLFFEAVGKGSSALSLTRFDCNKADAEGGFSIEDGIYESIHVVAR